MYTKGVRVQLVVFSVIATLSIGYLLFGYADGARTLGLSTYQIRADFRDTSGLYPRALVTYRGVQVGRVNSLDLTRDGVSVSLTIDSGVRVPAGALAEIHSTSAVGEQYVDLLPDRRDGPFIAAGATIPVADTREMPQIAPVLDKLNGLLKSVPKPQTARLLDQITAGFGSSADDLQRVLDSSTDLVATATAHLKSTKQLLTAVEPVLKTQTDLGHATASYLASLAGVSDELKQNDPHLRSVLATGAPALDAVHGLVGQLTPTFSILMANLVSTGAVLNMYVPAIKQTLVVYPAVIDRFQGTAEGSRAAGVDKLDLKLNLNNPPSCTQGYIPHSKWRDPSITTPVANPGTLTCTMPGSSVEGVRGARNFPCPNDGTRRAAEPAGCGLVFPGEQFTAYSGSDSAGGGQNKRVEPNTVIVYSPEAPASSWTQLLTGPLT